MTNECKEYMPRTPIRCICPDIGEYMPIPGECDGCFFAGDCIDRYEYLNSDLMDANANEGSELYKQAKLPEPSDYKLDKAAKNRLRFGL